MSNAPWRFAQTAEDAEVVRLIRNAGREWFGDSTYIAVSDQLAWWSANKEDIRCVIVGDPPTGYGMVSRRENRSWVSLAVVPEARGRGWGKMIYELLARVVGGPIYAAIKVDNVASRKAAEHAGFVRCAAVPPGLDPTRLEEWIVLRYPEPQEDT